MKIDAMTESDQLAQLKRDYEQDCSALRLGLYGKPWLLEPRLQERGERFDEDVIAVLSQPLSNKSEETIG